MTNTFMRQLVWWMTNLDFWFIVFLLLGAVFLWTRWWPKGRTLVAVSSLILIMACVSPLPDFVATYLENRFSRPAIIPEDVTGFVVVGFGIDRRVTQSRDVISFNCACQRELTLIELHKKYPQKKFVYTAGGLKIAGLDSLSEMAHLLFKRHLGKGADSIIYEDQAIDTRNNAKYTYNLVKPKPGEKWVLVTSALNMPRAMGSFRAMGWPRLIPYPVDYRTTAQYDITFNLSVYHGFRTWTAVMYEIIGLIYYYFAGYIKEFLPSPEPAHNEL